MNNKYFISGKLTYVLIFGLLVITFSCEIENSWDEKQYGELTVVNNSSSSIYSIKILEYSDESGAKIIDTNELSQGSSRTYKKGDPLNLGGPIDELKGGGDVMNIKFHEGFGGHVDKERTIKISSFSKRIKLSAGQNIELIVTDTGLTLTNPIYEP
jgi:hypothetical protein